ncbi:cytoglobin-2-like [Xenia sp. Carnegie-2017]|uniref:cytoglobin-2-like n=1 Tax=Xenia sp. Carnegie-2017 TaxID=2897299 RepID=UPI001F04737E|nr:cytoglobin-2-like [Xenia sp. Carnegie-2017]XP_046849135.1 cytoglobin-2-like [Xenia sp. Carnegie-2017]
MTCKQESVQFSQEQTENSAKEDMLTKHVQNVEETWVLVKKDLVGNGAVFLFRFIGQNPEIKDLFSFGPNFDIEKDNHDHPELRKQAAVLMKMIDYAVRCLHDLTNLTPKLKALGKKHYVKYNVKPEYFKPAIPPLMWTLEKGLGNIFTREVEKSWRVIFGIVLDVMIEGAQEGIEELNNNALS